jgi:ABC-2 type transport system permease protein
MLNQLMLRWKLLKDDRLIIVLMTVMALGLTFVFSSSMNGEYNPKVMVVDEDKTAESENFISELNSGNLFDYELVGYDEAVETIERGHSIAGVLLREGFSKSIFDDRDIDLEIIKSKDSLELYQLKNAIDSSYFKFISKFKTAVATISILQDEGVMLDVDQETESTYELGSKYWKNRNPYKMESIVLNAEREWTYNPLIHYLIGYTLFFSTFTIVFSGADILKEKQQHTWQRKLVSPVSNSVLVSSVLISTFLVGMFQVSIILLVGNYFLGIEWGMSMVYIFIIFAAFVYTFTAIGLLLSGIAKTFEQLSAMTPIVLVAAAMLGGTMWPLEIIDSKILLFLANLMPHKWALQTIEQAAAYGLDIGKYMTAVGVLLLMGTVYLVIGILLSRRNVY